LKLRIASLSLLVLCLAAVPAMAQGTVYSNGPINGTTDAWTINFGFVVSDTFTVGSSGATVNGLSFGAWTFPGDVLENAGVQITSSEFGGTTFFSGTVNFTQSACSGNQYGFNVCTETGSFSNVNLAAGTYWLNLDNAVVNDGDPVYWDENSGPSSASENTVGTIPSEAFTVLGGSTTTTSATSVPEPSSIMLFGSGILGLAGVLRRKLF
jgi:PEP-CTERM motif